MAIENNPGSMVPGSMAPGSMAPGSMVPGVRPVMPTPQRPKAPAYTPKVPKLNVAMLPGTMKAPGWMPPAGATAKGAPTLAEQSFAKKAPAAAPPGQTIAQPVLSLAEQYVNAAREMLANNSPPSMTPPAAVSAPPP